MCTPLNATLASFCAGVVPWNISSSLSQDTLDASAASLATERDDTCPLFWNAGWQCQKVFPRCTQDGNDTIIQKLCKSDCFSARTANDRICSRFSEDYFNSECKDADFSGAADCIRFPFPGSDDGVLWQWILVGICILIGVTLLASWFYTRWKAKRFDPDNDPGADDAFELPENVASRRSGGGGGSYGDLRRARPVQRASRQPPTLAERERAFNQSRENQERAQQLRHGTIAVLPDMHRAGEPDH